MSLTLISTVVLLLNAGVPMIVGLVLYLREAWYTRHNREPKSRRLDAARKKGDRNDSKFI